MPNPTTHDATGKKKRLFSSMGRKEESREERPDQNLLEGKNDEIDAKTMGAKGQMIKAIK